MTNAELIATIRAEIERLQPNAPKPGSMKSVDAKVAMQVHARLNKLLSFISDLEKSLLAKVSDGEELENELVRFYLKDLCVSEDDELTDATRHHHFPIMWDDLRDIARHFYELGKQSRPKISDNSLEEEIEEYFPESTFNTGFNYDDLQEIARHFAQWGARHLVDNHKMTRDVKNVAAEKAREYALSLPGGERTTAVGSTYSENGYYHGFIDGSKFKSDEKKFY